LNIRDIENQILAKLKENFPEFLVQGFPEKPQEFVLLHPTGAILVHYRGANYSTSNTIFYISQEKTSEFAVTIVTRNLRANEGAYETLDRVKQVLSGYKIPECTKLIPVKEGFISEINGIWQYEITFKLTNTSIENTEDIT